MTLCRLSAACLPACALLLACQSDPTGPLAPGSWGGTGAFLVVAADSALVELDCAHGVIRGTIEVDLGSFRQTGDYVAEGGPVSSEDPPETRSALYLGSLDGSELRLSIQVDGHTMTIGPFTLHRDADPVLRKCL